MKETGTVLKTEKNIALVEVVRKSACGENCAMCKGACTAPIHKAKAVNEIGAKVGDTVVLETESASLIKGAAALYLVPVLILIAAYIITYALSANSLASIAVSVLCTALYILIPVVFDKALAPKIFIVEIYNKERQNGS